MTTSIRYILNLRERQFKDVQFKIVLLMFALMNNGDRSATYRYRRRQAVRDA